MHEKIALLKSASVWTELVDQFSSTQNSQCRHNARGALEVLPSTLLTEVLREVAVGYDRWVRLGWSLGEEWLAHVGTGSWIFGNFPSKQRMSNVFFSVH